MKKQIRYEKVVEWDWGWFTDTEDSRGRRFTRGDIILASWIFIITIPVSLIRFLINLRKMRCVYFRRLK